jgi:hypothetical protein
MISIDIDHFSTRILQDALTEATAGYWERRGQQFEDAIPRSGEYRGNATQEQLTAATVRCAFTAVACRRHAQLLRESMSEPISDEVRAALGEVA